MPFSPFTKFLAAVGAVLGGGKLWSDYKAKKRRKGKKAKRAGVPSCLENVWSLRQELIPDIYQNLNSAGQSTADQFFGFNLSPQAQGQLFERLAQIYVEDVETYTGDAALTVMSEVAPCDWGNAEWTQTMADAMASAEAMAMVVLADIQNVVIPFEQPPVAIVGDPTADQCVASIYVAQPQPLMTQISSELKPAAAELASGETFHLTQEAQAQAFVRLAELAVNEPDVWNTNPILATLQTIAPQCAWERKDHYTAKMADIYYGVDTLYEVVATDIM